MSLLLAAIVLVGDAVLEGPRDATDARLAKVCQELQTEGCAVAVYSGGKLVYAKGFGFANRESDTPASAATIFRLGSISKSVTATAAMQLWEDGKLDLDRDVRSYASAFPEKKWPVSARQILSHTSGIRHYSPSEGAVYQYFPTASAAIARFGSDPLQFQPGTKFQYSTHAWTVLAAAMEKIEGRPFPQVMERRVFAKLKGGTLACEDARAPRKNRTVLYQNANGSIRQAGRREDNSWKYAGGGMESDAPTLARFGSELLAGKIVKKSTLEQMTQPAKLLDGKPASTYGLGFALDSNGNFGHSGAQQGCRTDLLLNPKANIVICAMANTSGGPSLSKITDELMTIWAPAR